MIICKTPFRISFFGGGTDFPAWYKKHSGIAISSTINKYCYVMLKHADFIKCRYVIRYHKTESLNTIKKIKHPVVREVLNKYNKRKEGIEISHFSDLPGRSGIGSSSAFTVSMLNLVNHYNGKRLSKSDLAKKSMHMEQNILKEKVGSQDQYACAYGGFNEITFNKNRKIFIKRLNISQKKKNILENKKSIFFTGFTRHADKIEKDKMDNIKKKFEYFYKIQLIANEAKKILSSNNINFLHELSYLLNESWIYKKELSKKVSINKLDDLYSFALKNGAIGGKILGAGGGGFFMFISKNLNDKKRLIKNLRKLRYIDFKFENLGSHIIYKNFN